MLMISVFETLIFVQVQAQTNQLETPTEHFNRSSWKSMVEKTDYFKPEKANKEVVNTKQINEINLASLKYVMIGLAIVLIVFVLLRLFAADLFRKNENAKRKIDFSINEIEENLVDAPLYSWLEESIANKQYKLAIRIYYLIALQELNQRNFIQWHKDKTNYQYIKELANHPLGINFRHLTSVFERVWFSDLEEVNATDFQKIQSGFKSYIQTIQQPK